MKIFELSLPKLRYYDFFQTLTQYLEEENIQKGKVIFTPNPEICLKSLEDREFLEILQKADYLTSDGIGLFLAYQIQDILSSPQNNILFGRMKALFLLPYFVFRILFQKELLYNIYGDRICGSTLTEDLLYFCEGKGISIAILDPYFPLDVAKCESQKYFSENLKKVFPQLDFQHYILKDEDKKDILEKIRESKAKILFSTLGMKRQEISIIEALKVCPNIYLGLAVGSSFDYFTGFQKRAPKIFQQSGFEWLYRIFTSPNKLKRFGRIYKAVCVFPLKVLMYKK